MLSAVEMTDDVEVQAEDVEEESTLGYLQSMGEEVDQVDNFDPTLQQGDLVNDINDLPLLERSTTSEDSEKDDVVQELSPVRSNRLTIPESDNLAAVDGGMPDTPITITSSEDHEQLVTPIMAKPVDLYPATSAPTALRSVGEDEEEEGDEIKPLSPTTAPKSPVGSSVSKAGSQPGGGLGRKSSKWRQSIQNLSAAASKSSAGGGGRKVSAGREPVYKEPPTSYDAYVAHQTRIANNRISCQPTIHTTATLDAELREIKDKDQAHLVETFFM